MGKILGYIMGDIVRNRIVLAYTAVLLAFTLGLFALEGRPEKAMLSLLNIVLIVVPLVSVVFSTIYYYNAAEFMELVLAQPVDRTRVLLIEYAGLALSLSLAFLTGVGLPLLWRQPSLLSGLLLLAGGLITTAFVSLAFLGAVLFRDKARGIGMALLLWFFFALLFDGLLLLGLYSFSDYPLERATLLLTMLNPIDVGRMLVVTRLDAAALMGHSGDVFREFLGSARGWITTILVLLAWSALPLWAAVHIFRRKDL